MLLRFDKKKKDKKFSADMKRLFSLGHNYLTLPSQVIQDSIRPFFLSAKSIESVLF